MSSATEIRQHIRGVEQTRQITHAMRLIASSKMQKGLDRYQKNLVYMNSVRNTIAYILCHATDASHPYLEPPIHSNRTAYLVIAADKGMAGGYNSNVLKLAWEHMQSRPEKYVITAGQMAREFFVKQGVEVDMEYLHIMQDPSLRHARNVAAELADFYDQGLIDEVIVVYTRMISTMQQQATIMPLVPLMLGDFADCPVKRENVSMIWSPDEKSALDVLVPQYMTGIIYSALVQSFASEQCARANAMDSATRNADEMLDKLHLNMNQARQAAITQEISEIVSGADASSKKNW